MLSTRLIDTAKTLPGEAHVASGINIEVKDAEASCGVFIQVQKRESKQTLANVIVSLVENEGEIASRTIFSNSGVLSKLPISETDQDVLPNSAGTRSVSVEAAKLHRSCTVSVF